jgi:uncharacterized protein (DUF983 family)
VVVVVPGSEAAPLPSLVEGNQLRCPKCEQLGDLFRDFRALERSDKYAHELNMIYKHKACGHVFSPGDPQIIAAYLAGDLVPRALLDDAKRQLREGGVQAA